MRVLTVSHFYETHGGGIERVAGQLCRQFNELGATAVWAASNSDPSPTGIEAVPIACLNPTEKLTGLPMPIPGFRAMRTLSRTVRASDAVIIHDALYATSVAAMLLAKLFCKRVILIQHIAAIPFRSAPLRIVMKLCNTLITRPMLRAANAPVFISDVVRQDLLGASANERSMLIYNGVDDRLFHPSENIAEGGKAATALFVGRFVEKKGLNVLRAFAEMRPDVRIILAGGGPIDPKAWELSNVHDIGPQTPAKLAELYRSADVLLLPSVGEGFPLVIQEAMASGLPVICGSPSDRADPGASKWLCGVPIDLAKPDQSAKGIAEAFDSYRLSPLDRLEMVAYARQAYNWTSMAKRLLALADPNGA